MQKSTVPVLWLCLALMAGSAVSSGCSRSATSLDARDERDSLLRRARMKDKENDIDGAIELYVKALERKPYLARAHLELGILYDKHRENYLRAIYHYERYIEMRPDAEKRDLIEGLIRQAKLSYAASLPDRPSEAVDEIYRLKREIAMLRGELGLQTGAPATAGPAASGRQTAGEPGTPQPAPASPPYRTYQVQSGDTLSKIAQKMYSDASKWTVIYEANRAALPSPRSLKLGQTLVIPPAP